MADSPEPTAEQRLAPSAVPEAYATEAPAEPGERPLASYIAMVRDGKWTVVAVTAIVLALAFAYLFVAAPVYQAVAILQVEKKQRSFAGLDDLTAALSNNPPSEPEIAIIRSRTLLATVVAQLQLLIDAKSRTFPLVGRPIARRYQGDSPAQPPLGLLSRFAWGGERIDVEELEVPETLSDVPLLLTAQEGSRYSLADHEGTVILEGSVGALAVAGEGRTRVALLLSELVARPGTQFFVTRRSEDAVVDQILNSLQVEESGKSKDSGVLTITLVGGDPARLRDVLNAIAGAYLRQNVERRSAEAAKTLEFLEGQLPQLKANVEKAENALNAFKTRTGTLDPTAETKNLLDRLTQIEKQIGDAEVKRSELRQSFTGQHPALVSIANTIAVLRAERAAVAERIRAVPQAELSTERLARGLKDATEIYVGLLNKAQELRVAKSGTIGDVTIIDRAYVPSDPVKPQRRTILLAALLLGLVGGVAAAVMRRSWVERADSPEEVENATGLPVFVTVPHSDIQEKALRGSRRRRTPPAQLLAESSPDDPAVEAVRSLRTTLRFALVGTRNVVAFSGPAPAVGKSFLAMNLAHVLSATGSSVLLVDADLRRGWLHRQFGFDRAPGLSDVLSGSAAVGEVIRKVPGGLLSVLPTGSIPPNPAELLSNPALEAVLRTVSARYDLVIIDTPPVLAVTDAMLVARFAGVNFLVVRAGRHTHREIALAVKEFTINRVRLHGIVMNDMYFNGDRNAATGYIRYSYSSDASD